MTTETRRLCLTCGKDQTACDFIGCYGLSNAILEEKYPAAPQPEPDGELAELKQKYQELLFAVVCKFPNETRHETALRYIKEHESREVAGPSQTDNNLVRIKE